jgi:hypothetical protein
MAIGKEIHFGSPLLRGALSPAIWHEPRFTWPRGHLTYV